MMIKKMYNKYGQFIRFCIVGGTNTLVSLVVYTLLLWLGVHYIVASSIGYIAGILNGYILSSMFVFKEPLDTKKSFKFVFIYLTSLLINLLIITLLIEFFHVGKIISQILATGFNVVYNYSLNLIWTFNKKRK